MKVNRFCCFCTLQTGTKLIGFISLFCAIVEVMAYMSLKFQTQVQNPDEPMTTPYIIGIVLASAMALALTVSTLFLLTAAFKNGKPIFIMPWLVIFASTSVYVVAMLMYVGIFSLKEDDTELAAITIFGSLFLAGLTFYFCLVVYNYYKQLKNPYGYRDFVPDNTSNVTSSI